MNTLQYLSPEECYCILTDSVRIQDVDTEFEEYDFTESTTAEFIVKYFFDLRSVTSEKYKTLTLADSTKLFFHAMFAAKYADCCVDKEGILNLMLRNNDKFVDVVASDGLKRELNFGNEFGSWQCVESGNSCKMMPVFSRNPLYFNDFIESDLFARQEKPFLTYHSYIVSSFACPGFVELYKNHIGKDDWIWQFFLVRTIEDYFELLDFLCILFSKKHNFRIFRFTDNVLMQIVPHDGTIGSLGVIISSFLSNEICRRLKETTGIEVKTISKKGTFLLTLPSKIEVLHIVSKLFIMLYQKSMDLYNPDFEYNIENLYDDYIID